MTCPPTCSRWPWRLAVSFPMAVLSDALPLGGLSGGTAVGGAGQGGRSCRQTWCRVSSLCRRATRAALFSSVALHSSNAHWFRSAACPAAQVAATLPSSGVGAGQLTHSCGIGPTSPPLGGARSWEVRLCSRLAFWLHSSLHLASQWGSSRRGPQAGPRRSRPSSLSSQVAPSASPRDNSPLSRGRLSPRRAGMAQPPSSRSLSRDRSRSGILMSSARSLLWSQPSRRSRSSSGLPMGAPSSGGGPRPRVPPRQSPPLFAGLPSVSLRVDSPVPPPGRR